MNWRPVEKLLRAIRRRLWLQATLERLRLGVWAGSGILMLAAAMSLLGVGITPAMAVLAALSVTLGVTLTVLLRRPSLEACALRADRTFQTRALMVTALELSISTRRPASPAAAVVRKRACTMAPQLARQLGFVWRAPRPGGFMLAVVPIFVATVLFAVSDGDPTTSGDADDPLMSLGVAGQSRLDPDTSLQDLRHSIASSAMPRSERSEVERNAAPSSVMPKKPAAASTSDAMAVTESGDANPGLPTESAQGGREAGRTQRNTALFQNHELTGSTPSSRAILWLRRRGEVTAGVDDSGRGFEEGALPSVPGESGAQASAAPPTLSAWTTLSPAEAAYARRYLGKETDHD